MRKKLILGVIISIALFASLAIASTLHEKRIEQYKKTCKSLGFKPQTSEHANCVLDLEKSYLSSRGAHATGTNTTNQDARMQQMINQDRQQKQILNHGAGGCTPNFATGGCL